MRLEQGYVRPRLMGHPSHFFGSTPACDEGEGLNVLHSENVVRSKRRTYPSQCNKLPIPQLYCDTYQESFYRGQGQNGLQRSTGMIIWMMW